MIPLILSRWYIEGHPRAQEFSWGRLNSFSNYCISHENRQIFENQDTTNPMQIVRRELNAINITI